MVYAKNPQCFIYNPVVMDPLELDAMRQNELNNLKRRFKVLTSAKPGRLLKDSEYLRLYKIRSLLKKELYQTHYTIKVSSKGRNKIRSLQNRREMAQLLIHMGRLDFESMQSKLQICELDVMIELAKKQYMKQYKKYIKLNITGRELESSLRLRNMENVLEKSMLVCGKVNTDNSMLRFEINMYLKTRALFIRDFNSVINRLVDGKVILKTILDRVEEVSQDRQSIIAKLHNLNEQSDFDLMNDLSEMRYLSCVINDLYKVHDFLRVKGSIRDMSDLEQRREDMAAKENRDCMDKIMELEKLLNSALNWRKKEVIGDLVQSFLSADEFIFSLVLLMCHQGNELEPVRRLIANVVKQVEIARQDNIDREERRNLTIQRLKHELEEMEGCNKSLENQLTNSQTTIHETLASIEEIFHTCKLNVRPLLRLLPKTYRITEHNFGFFVRNIETYVLELIQIVYQSRQDDKSTDKKKKLIEQSSISKRMSKSKSRSVRHPLKSGIFEVRPILQEPLVATNIKNLVTYIPCVYCVEDYVFRQVSEQPFHPITKEEALGMLRVSPFNTPYGITTQTDPSELHTDRMMRLSEQRAEAAEHICD